MFSGHKLEALLCQIRWYSQIHDFEGSQNSAQVPRWMYWLQYFYLKRQYIVIYKKLIFLSFRWFEIDEFEQFFF